MPLRVCFNGFIVVIKMVADVNCGSLLVDDTGNCQIYLNIKSLQPQTNLIKVQHQSYSEVSTAKLRQEISILMGYLNLLIKQIRKLVP